MINVCWIWEAIYKTQIHLPSDTYTLNVSVVTLSAGFKGYGIQHIQERGTPSIQLTVLSEVALHIFFMKKQFLSLSVLFFLPYKYHKRSSEFTKKKKSFSYTYLHKVTQVISGIGCWMSYYNQLWVCENAETHTVKIRSCSQGVQEKWMKQTRKRCHITVMSILGTQDFNWEHILMPDIKEKLYLQMHTFAVVKVVI